MESISRISSLLETARDLTLEAATQAGPRRSTKPLPPPQIKKLLDSRNERDVLDGLRRVIAMQYAVPAQPTLTFFPSVLKTLSNPYPSTRPLVYNYLIHHAEADPDTALLAINTIQKSLSDTNPRVRAMALKTMSGIRVPVISQIVSLAIKKGVSDLSPLVRKAAALACVKCVGLDPNMQPQVEEYLSSLLADKQYYVAGAAVQAFLEVCPDRLDLIHPVYRRLCKMIVDMDEWGQLAVLRLMTVYARKCFPKRTKRVKRTAQSQAEKAKDFYEDLEPQADNDDDYEEVEVLDPDLDLFLTSTTPLLQSRNAAVIIAVTRAYLYLSPTTHLQHAIGPLIALLRSPQDIQQTALYNIVQICLFDATLFVPHMRHFLLKAAEAPTIRSLKLEALTLIFPHSTKEMQDLILAELEHFSRSHDPTFVREAVRAIGRCAQSSSSQTSRRCLALLLKQIHSPDENLVGESIEVVRHLIQRSLDEHRKTVVRLAKNLDTLTSSVARANVIWLVGEFAGGDVEEGIAADVLRILLRGYADEKEEVKAQIVLLAARVYLHYLNAKNAKQKAVDALSPPASSAPAPDYSAIEGEDRGFQDPPAQESEQKHTIELLWQHTLLLAHYTPSYSLRDRARTYRALLSTPSNTDLASLLLLAPKPVPQQPSPSESRRDFLLGSGSLVVGEKVRAEDVELPDWVEEGEEPDARLREDGAVESAGRQVAAGEKLDSLLSSSEKGIAGTGFGGVGAGSGKAKALDDWLDEEDEEEESSEEEEDEEESSEEDEESEYEAESEEDERAGLVR